MTIQMNAPGVYVQEKDMSEIVPSTSASTCVFAGNFTKGYAGIHRQITSVDDLIEFYGLPTNDNYNDWYQAYNFLQYGNDLLISRAINSNGSAVNTKSKFVESTSGVGYGTTSYGTEPYGIGDTSDVILVSFTKNISAGDVIGFSNNVVNSIDESKTNRYYVVDTYSVTKNETTYTALVLDRSISYPESYTPTSTDTIDSYYLNKNCYKIKVHFNGSCEALKQGNSTKANITWKTDVKKYQDYEGDELVTKKFITPYTAPIRFANWLCGSDTVSHTTVVKDGVTMDSLNVLEPSKKDPTVLFKSNKRILNPNDWDLKYASVSFGSSKSKLKFISKTVGTEDAAYEIAIALPTDFASNDKDHVGNHCTRYIQEGIAIDSFFEYAPALNSAQVAVFIYDTKNNVVKETFLCSLDPDEVDSYNNSMFIETVINRNSNCVYVKCDTSSPASVSLGVDVFDETGDITGTEVITVPNLESYTLVADLDGKYYGNLLKFCCASDSDIQEDDLLEAYEVFDNKDLIDIDIVIANELDNGVSAKNLVESREDCIAFMGIPFSYDNKQLTVGQRTADATSNIVNYRNSINYNSMWISLIANYKYQYDRYNDTYRWINVAGDVAGLRAASTEDYAAWWASAGLNRGQVKNVSKLAYSPNKTQIGTLYNNGINAIVTFPGQGTVLWGQKTMLNKSSSFDRVNVRGLFNVLERSLAKMSKYNVFEFNDTFTRNKIISSITPYLETVKSDRGITDYMVICDTTNNTSDIISRNQLIVDIYIKPVYVAEFILLRFSNAGVNDFSTIIQTS